MKRTIFILVAVLSLSMVSCKNGEEKSETTADTEALVEEGQDQNAPLYRGEFIYQNGAQAGVLMGSNFIYGVVLDDMAKSLAAQVEPVKKDSTDMVPVVIRGIVTKNPDISKPGEGWDEIITIKEIIAVSDKPAEADIKIEESKD